MNHDEHGFPSEPPPTGQPAPAAASWPPPPYPPPPRRGPLPIPAGVPYHRVLAGEERRIWRGIAALALLLGGMLLFSIGLSVVALLIDLLLGRQDSMMLGGTGFTPALQAASMASLALLIPWSMLVQRWLYGVRGASLHSVRSLLRPEVLVRSFMVILPLWTVYLTAFTFLSPVEESEWPLADLFWMFAITVLLVPLQSAGEEYGLRGLAFRVAASWGRGPRTALVLGVAVSSLLFMVVHFALDPWLNVYYFTFGATLALITWRTGGLETAIVIHAVNNTLAFLLVIVTHSDLAAGFDRSVGTGSPIMLVPCVLLIAATAVVWARTRGSGSALTPSEPSAERVPAMERNA
ncbi:CPBP family intramembrane glutamic endopeptidase [Nocardiopsis sp. LOL_012]|uniref:CPBP family intramembrane glutamic endopeptidase n=1 Tax=Nocardiopsis sp. LOL_012 TaxID=3345409 RepID=UPI003A8BEAA3